MKAKGKATILIVLLLCIVLIMGCGNNRELKDLAIVMAMGVDKVPSKKEYRVSFQIVNSSEVLTGGAGGSSGRAVPVTIYSGTGNNIFDTIRNTSQKVPRQLFFAHLRMVVIGETLAKEGVKELFDFFERSKETRLTTHVLVARKSTAESIISTITPLEAIPANSIVGKLETTEKVWSKNVDMNIHDVINSLTSEGREIIISGVRIVGDQRQGIKKSNNEQTKPLAYAQIKEIALFKEGKLKRWLDSDEARGVIWIRDKMKSTIVNLDYKEKKDCVGIEVIRSKTDVKAEVRHGVPVIHIKIREEGNISELRCAVDPSEPDETKKLQDEWIEETKKEVMAAVKAAQNEKSDIFGFGEALNLANPEAWEKMKKDWNQIFAICQVNVEVDAFIRRSGMRMEPYFSEKKK